MTSYLAVKDNSGVYLSRSEQMDKMLADGFSIYEVDDDGTETLIATPQDGFLTERPTIEQYGTMSII